MEGFVDRTGNATSNQRLSTQSVKTTTEALGRPAATTRRLGEPRHLHTNDLSEGRFYCRTVHIMLKTPVK